VHCLYILGIPGAGKTTALREALKDRPAWRLTFPVSHIRYAGGLLQLGKQHPLFGGTDTLPFNAKPVVLQWLTSYPAPFLVAEGDRLANTPFFSAVTDYGYVLDVVWLRTSEATAEQRRAHRGSEQSETWLKSRSTKVAALAATWNATIIDGDASVERIAAQLNERAALRLSDQAYRSEHEGDGTNEFR
jgi:hypothetical protein